MQIVIVDDDPGTREFYRAAFEDAGYVVRVAEDTLSGIDLATSFTPELLLLDWDMPGGGGGVVFKELLRRGLKIPTLFVTGSPDKINVDPIPVKTAVLKKPASVSKIFHYVEYLLEK